MKVWEESWKVHMEFRDPKAQQSKQGRCSKILPSSPAFLLEGVGGEDEGGGVKVGGV